MKFIDFLSKIRETKWSVRTCLKAGMKKIDILPTNTSRIFFNLKLYRRKAKLRFTTNKQREGKVVILNVCF